MEQWELKNNSKVKLADGRIVTFIKMDGMYAHWDIGGMLKTGNYQKFEKVENKEYKYKVVIQ